MAKFTRTLAAGTGENLDVAGTGIMVKATVGFITVLPSNRNASRKMTGGDTWTLRDPVEDPSFKNIHVKNDNAAPITYTIEVFEAGHDLFESQSAAAVVGVTQEATSNPWVTREKPTGSNVDGTVTVGAASGALVAANAANILVTIQPQGGDIYIALGAAATATSASMLITDGSVYEVRTTEVINAIRAGAASVTTHWRADRA